MSIDGATSRWARSLEIGGRKQNAQYQVGHPKTHICRVHSMLQDQQDHGRAVAELFKHRRDH